MRRIATTAAILASTVLGQQPHGLTAPRNDLERAFVAIWLTETSRIGYTGAIRPPPGWVWDPVTGSSRGYGMLQVGREQFLSIRKAMPPIGENGWMDHWQLEEPFYSWLFFVVYIDATIINPMAGDPSSESPTVEMMVRAWADSEGWRNPTPRSTAYWGEARRFVL